MANAKRRRLESMVAVIQQRYGVRALRVARDLPKVSRPAAIATSFPDLGAMTGYWGVPLGAITLLTGPSTSGKLTVAHKTLTAAQQNGRHPVALMDLTHSTDPDYLARCCPSRLSAHGGPRQGAGFPGSPPIALLPLPSDALDTLCWLGIRTHWEYELMGLSTESHLLAHHRADLRRAGVSATWEVKQAEAGRRMRVAGLAVIRQRPATAKGMVFLSLEDESGLLDCEAVTLTQADKKGT